MCGAAWARASFVIRGSTRPALGVVERHLADHSWWAPDTEALRGEDLQEVYDRYVTPVQTALWDSFRDGQPFATPPRFRAGEDNEFVIYNDELEVRVEDAMLAYTYLLEKDIFSGISEATLIVGLKQVVAASRQGFTHVVVKYDGQTIHPKTRDATHNRHREMPRSLYAQDGGGTGDVFSLPRHWRYVQVGDALLGILEWLSLQLADHSIVQHSGNEWPKALRNHAELAAIQHGTSFDY